MTRRSAGETISTYVIEDWIGSGASADVYRAHDARLDRRVALKILRSDFVNGGPRLLREVRAAARVLHPNIVRVFDIGETDEGTPFLVMELLSGQSLRNAMRDEIPFAVRLRWIDELAEALAALHDGGLVHGDVKPENVFVTADQTLKLVDFGLAREVPAVDREAITRTLREVARVSTSDPVTAGGIVMGTPAYMAPEQMRGEPLDARADQFAWAVVVWELLTGHRPWQGVHEADLVARMLTERPAGVPTDDDPRAIVALEAARRALARDRQHRFASMDEIRRDMRADPARSTGFRRARDGRLRFLAYLAFAAAGAVIMTVAAIAALRPPPARYAPIRDGGLPSTKSMEGESAASIAFREGVQAYRDGSVDAAWYAFERAVDLDPSFAQANLHVLMINLGTAQGPRQYQELQNAQNHRAQLSERDRAILNAIQPWFRVPPNAEAVEQRFRALLDARPNDAELAVWICHFRIEVGDDNGAQTACALALQSEPDLPVGLLMQGWAMLDIGNATGARTAFARCTERSPAAATCWRDRAYVDGGDGRCEDAEHDVRGLIALDPLNFQGYGMLANILAHAGNADAAQEANRRYSTLVSSQIERLIGDGLLSTWRGDFIEADAHFREATRADINVIQDSRQQPYWQRMQLALESGEPERAAAVAHQLLHEAPGWVRSEDDPRIDAWCMLHRLGQLGDAEWQHLVREWRSNQAQKSGIRDTVDFDRWQASTVCGIRTPADARTAISEIPSDVRLARMRVIANAGDAASLGHLFLLAGDTDAAMPFLSRAAQSCNSLTYAMEQTQAMHDLAVALARKGDRAAACAADREVVTRWGHAQPRSLTAEAARANLQALQCGAARP